MKRERVAEVYKGRECTGCGKVYMRPCDGNDKQCLNLIWAHAQQQTASSKKGGKKK